jgi:hypothetical protein
MRAAGRLGLWIGVFVERPASATFAGPVGATALLTPGEVDAADSLDRVRDDFRGVLLAVRA